MAPVSDVRVMAAGGGLKSGWFHTPCGRGTDCSQEGLEPRGPLGSRPGCSPGQARRSGCVLAPPGHPQQRSGMRDLGLTRGRQGRQGAPGACMGRGQSRCYSPHRPGSGRACERCRTGWGRSNWISAGAFVPTGSARRSGSFLVFGECGKAAFRAGGGGSSTWEPGTSFRASSFGVGLCGQHTHSATQQTLCAPPGPTAPRTLRKWFYQTGLIRAS